MKQRGGLLYSQKTNRPWEWMQTGVHTLIVEDVPSHDMVIFDGHVSVERLRSSFAFV